MGDAADGRRIDRAPPMPTCSARPPATACGWPTPSSSSRSRRDLTIYGEEVKFGGGKVIRDGMGQSQATRAEGAVDTVITNALIIDHWGIVKADIGIKDGRIAGIGKAGNPDVQPGVDHHRSARAPRSSPAKARSSPPAASTAHIHFICPQQIEEALIVAASPP